MSLRIFGKPHRHEVREIPLAPILDLMVVVIFFLVLSTSFVQFTKHTIPPSSVSVAPAEPARRPLQPKLIVVRRGPGLYGHLTWRGETPGKRELTSQAQSGPNRELITRTSEVIGEFKRKFPAEKSIQLGFGKDVTYQEVISVMDGVMNHIRDVALVSYSEATLLSP